MSCVWSRTTVRSIFTRVSRAFRAASSSGRASASRADADQDVRGHRVDPGAIAGDGQEGRVGVLHRCEHLPRPAVRRERLVLTTGAIQGKRHVAEGSDQLMGDPCIGKVRPEEPLA